MRIVILPLVDACLVLLFGIGESLIIRPQDKGPVPEMSDKVIDAILRDYLSMETRDKWFNFGHTTTLPRHGPSMEMV